MQDHHSAVPGDVNASVHLDAAESPEPWRKLADDLDDLRILVGDAIGALELDCAGDPWRYLRENWLPRAYRATGIEPSTSEGEPLPAQVTEAAQGINSCDEETQAFRDEYAMKRYEKTPSGKFATRNEARVGILNERDLP